MCNLLRADFQAGQAGLDARTRPTASMTGTRMLRSIINRRRGDSAESPVARVEEASQARSPGLKLRGG